MTDTALFVTPNETVYGAELSDCGLYRYRLWRTWGSGLRMAWVMLNPSTADAEVDDPTIRRCMGFARREGYDGIEVINLYALRATKPKHLLDHPDPEGPDNWRHWNAVLSDERVGAVVAAWGAGRPKEGGVPLLSFVYDNRPFGMSCLGTTKHGDPRHPLYVRADQPLEPFEQTTVSDRARQPIGIPIWPHMRMIIAWAIVDERIHEIREIPHMLDHIPQDVRVDCFTYILYQMQRQLAARAPIAAHRWETVEGPCLTT